jgi:hypothetical protein
MHYWHAAPLMLFIGSERKSVKFESATKVHSLPVASRG